MKTSAIKHATGNGTWERDGVLFYSYIVDFENGDQCLFNAKSPDAYTMGMTIDYELTGKTDRNQTPYARKVNKDFKGWTNEPYKCLLRQQLSLLSLKSKRLQILRK